VGVLPFAAAGAALALESAIHLANFGLDDLRIRMLDSNYEWSYSHLLATGAFATGAVTSVIAARSGVRRARTWWTAGALFAFLAVDGATRIHEHIPAWPVVYAPVLVCLCVAVASLAEGTDEEPVVRAGIALLALSIVIHVFGPGVVHRLGWSPEGWAYQSKVALKEGTELAGWVLLVPALVRLAAGSRHRDLGPVAGD
jgi:hypothetical protein